MTSMGNKFLAALLGTLLIMLAAPAVRDGHAEDAAANEIVFSGKVYCSLKRPVVLPFEGVVTEVPVHNGDVVKEDQVVGRYALPDRILFDLKRRLAHLNLIDQQRRIEEINLERKKMQKELARAGKMSKEGLVPEKRIEDLREQLGLNADRHEYTVKRKELDERIAKEEDRLLAKQLGVPIENGEPPEEAVLRAPIDGHVVWVNSAYRERAELGQGTHVMTVGVMDPMLLVANVHEIEAIHLKVGDAAKFEPESLRDRTFEATVNRISWTTLTPQQDRPSYYEVEFIVHNPDFELKEGFRGRVTMNQ